MILLDYPARRLLPARLVILGILGWVPNAGADEFPKTFRELRENFDGYLTSPRGLFVFSVFPDGLSHLDRNGALHLGQEITRCEAIAPRRAVWPQYPGPDVYFVNHGTYRVWVGKFRSRGEAVDLLFKKLQGLPEEYRLPEAAIMNPLDGPVYPEPPRHFLGIEWKGETIGQFSFGKRFGGWEGHALYSVTFLMGNLLITVEGRPQGDVETPLDPDPRQTAMALDRYYSSDPTETLTDAEKRERNTLRVEIESSGRVVIGTTYALDCPLKQDGKDLTEVRFRVTQGEVLEVVNDVPEKPRRGTLPLEDRRFSVRFARPGRQTLSCYHITAEGECIAWGELEVDVVKE